MQKPTLVIGIPFSGRYVPPEWAMSIATLQFPMNTNYSYITMKGMKRDLCREYLADRAVACGAKYLLMLDDDTVPPCFTVKELMYALDNADDDVVFCGGIYTTKEIPAVPTIAKESGGGPFMKWKTGDVFDCPFVATGCMMIKTEVFTKIPKPWFRDVNTVAEAKSYGLETPEDNTFKYEMTDDIFFCHKVQSAGFKGLAHGGVLPVHFDDCGNAFRLDENSYPVKHGTVDLDTGFGFQLTKHVVAAADEKRLTRDVDVTAPQASEVIVVR